MRNHIGTVGIDIEKARLFSDETRVRILKLLAEHGELTNSQLSDMLGVGESTVFYHLKLLKDGGIVKLSRTEREPHGIIMRYYKLRSALLPAVYALLPELALTKLLGDKTRVQILRLLAEHGELTNSQLARMLGIGKSTISYHLKLLKGAGLVRARKVDEAGRSIPTKMNALVPKMVPSFLRT